jgi:FliI/YscN family ATPase
VIARGAGWVTRTLGGTVLAALPGARVGDGVRIGAPGGASCAGAVVAVERARVAIAPFGPLEGIAVGDRVEIDGEALAWPFGRAALGRALDARGAPLDGGPPARPASPRAAVQAAPAPLERRPVRVPFWTGVRAVDGLLTIGRGARVGFFGAPGTGKTTLLETIASCARADVVVLALIGERGREAQRWFARVDARTTVVCATADRSAAERARAAEVAMLHAQTLRLRGAHVALIVDSVARYAAALREQRVALGEACGRGGFPPGVWSDLAGYLERAGNAGRGSITLLCTVLSDGDDERDPLAESARSLLDGHIVLAPKLARAGRFPAIDIPASVSRTMPDVVDAAHAADATALRAALALLAESEDARSLGLNDQAAPPLAAALAAEHEILAFLYSPRAAAPGSARADVHRLARLLTA